MEARNRSAAAVLLVLAGTALTGCSDSGAVAGSCGSATLSDGARICVDYYDDDRLGQWRSACGPLLGGQWSEAPCDSASALAGCVLEGGQAAIWMYASERHGSAADVEAACAEKGRTFVSAGWSPR